MSGLFWDGVLFLQHRRSLILLDRTSWKSGWSWRTVNTLFTHDEFPGCILALWSYQVVSAEAGDVIDVGLWTAGFTVTNKTCDVILHQHSCSLLGDYRVTQMLFSPLKRIDGLTVGEYNQMSVIKPTYCEMYRLHEQIHSSKAQMSSFKSVLLMNSSPAQTLLVPPDMWFKSIAENFSPRTSILLNQCEITISVSTL